MSNKYREESFSLDFAGTVQSVINRSFIVDYGIVQDIPAKGIVTVEMSCARNKEDVRIVTCVLANIASKAFTIDLEPVVGDKVIVFFPRSYNEEMFDEANKEVLISEGNFGYTMFSGVAFLFNQCKTKSYKNLITADKDGNFELKIGDKVDIQLNADGTMNITNGTAKIEVASDNAITINGHLKVTS